MAPADYGDTFVFQLGNNPPVTATFGSALNLGTNTFNTAADLINVLNNGGSGNFAGQAAATTDGTGGVLLTGNDVVNNFAATAGTAITSSDVSGANVTNTNLSLGSALTVSDGSHNSTLLLGCQQCERRQRYLQYRRQPDERSQRRRDPHPDSN